MSKRKEINNNVVTTARAASTALGIDVSHIMATKKLGCPHSQDRYYLNELREWYQNNKDEVIEFVQDNTTTNKNGEWKQRKERAQALIAEINLKELEKKTLDKDKVISFLKQIAGSQAILLRNMAQELPHKLLGKDLTNMQIELNKAYDNICSKFKESLDKWK
jgi:hypothetical protein